MRSRRNGIQALLTAIPCGVRIVTIVTSSRWMTAGLHRRILATFRCHPDASEEAALAVLPVVVGVPDGWQPTAKGGELILTHGPEASVILRRRPGMSADDAAFAAYAAGLARAGMSLQTNQHRIEHGPHGDRPVWTGTLDRPSGAVAATVSLWPCATRGETLVAIYLHPTGTDDAAGLTVLLDARCAEPGEAIPDYAPTPAAD